jgi:hypothetical protein
LQLFGALTYDCTIFGFNVLYATFTCIACSQLEKLRANLLAIRQRHVTSEQDSNAETDLEEGQGLVNIPQEVFHHMQEQLNDCIRHHQEIMRCVKAEIIKYEYTKQVVGFHNLYSSPNIIRAIKSREMRLAGHVYTGQMSKEYQI